MDLMELSAPISPADISLRPGGRNKEKTKAIVLAYIDANAVFDRLDQVCGPTNWEMTNPEVVMDGQVPVVKVGIAITVEDEAGVSQFVTKYGFGYPNRVEDGVVKDDEPLKSAHSDALKRAAWAWGIGRELRHAPQFFWELNQWGRFADGVEHEYWRRVNGGKASDAPAPATRTAPRVVDQNTGEVTGEEGLLCPKCGNGTLVQKTNSKTKKPFWVCSTSRYDTATKTASGCDWIQNTSPQLEYSPKDVDGASTLTDTSASGEVPSEPAQDGLPDSEPAMIALISGLSVDRGWNSNGLATRFGTFWHNEEALPIEDRSDRMPANWGKATWKQLQHFYRFLKVLPLQARAEKGGEA